MVEALLLLAVQRHVRGVNVEHDLARRPLVALQVQVQQQPVELLEIDPDLTRLARVGAGRRQFQAVQRALAGQRLAVGATRLQPPDAGLQGLVLAQLVVVVEVLVPEHQAVQALAQHGGQVMHQQLGVATVLEAGREPLDHAQAFGGHMHELRAAVGGDLSAREIDIDGLLAERGAGGAGELPGTCGRRLGATGMARGSGYRRQRWRAVVRDASCDGAELSSRHCNLL